MRTRTSCEPRETQPDRLTKPIEHYKQREKLTESIIAFTDTDPLQEVI